MDHGQIGHEVILLVHHADQPRQLTTRRLLVQRAAVDHDAAAVRPENAGEQVLPRVFIADSAIVIEELSERRWDVGFVGARLLGRGLAEQGFSLPAHQMVMVLGTTQAVISAVEHGYGLGWVSSLALEPRRAERVRLARLAGIRLRRVLSMVYDTRRPLPAPAAAFVDWMAAHVQPPATGT